jgi:hypothetical protein
VVSDAAGQGRHLPPLTADPDPGNVLASMQQASGAPTSTSSPALSIDRVSTADRQPSFIFRFVTILSSRRLSAASSPVS